MKDHLYPKFIALILIKGLVVGYAQWRGVFKEPINPPLTMHPSELTLSRLQTITPSAFAQQNIHQF